MDQWSHQRLRTSMYVFKCADDIGSREYQKPEEVPFNKRL